MGIKLPSEPPETLGTWQSLRERTGVRPGLQTVVLVEMAPSVHHYLSYVTLPQQKLKSLGKLKIVSMNTGIPEQRLLYPDM